MGYHHGDSKARLEALRHRQQVEAAEVERAEKELAEIMALEAELDRMRRNREYVAGELRKHREGTVTHKTQLRLPEPIYGGRKGLLAAVAEAKEHEYKLQTSNRTT
ncbi:hypothetical protein [Pseudarthrobacter sp. PS3-L1]|uniref:hypothetical protein n=1 Tax=Pseudarthrobacter sp. PS3-L1 TaxID=3046207 RepID=UPI0024B965F4|nr:hypothetical protein [Pseudarthrobacter sp. PS3-L1]MDJ0321678.1 hypothetical protein [Pseudarthrobacter sp. PS3-L1]